MIRRFPSRFRVVARWAVLLAGWSIPTAGQQNVLARATATISGKISFEGVPPPNSPVQMSTDPYCLLHSADYATLETVKVSDGGLENVIIYVSSGLLPGVTYTAPTTPIELDQLNCHYIPHVLSAFVGVFDHPFHTVSKSGGLFELKLPPGYYEITAWHEKYGQKTMMVGVVDNERRVINITFAPNDK